MRPAGLAIATFLAAPILSAQSMATVPDGLSILQAMGRHYAEAKAWYIVATEERTTWNDYDRTWTKSVMIGAVSGNRYHFEGHSGMGSTLLISDGRTAWDLHPGDHAYTREAAPANRYQHPHTMILNEGVAQRAAGLLQVFAEMPSHYSGATRLWDESLNLSGKRVPCYVIRVGSQQRKGPHSADYTFEETLWIDRHTWAVRRTIERGNSYLIIAGTEHIPIQVLTTTNYSTAILNGAVPDSLFRFEPPQNAQLVSKFSSRIFGPDLTGNRAADVELVGPNGKRALLSSYRGKPVLLYFWATWCAPCIAGMPKLAALESEAGPKGLVLLSIDEDDDAKQADDYLENHHYRWPNTQDDGKIGDAFNKVGIPLYVLIDQTGRIIFYGNGSGAPQEAALRGAIAGLGPQFATLMGGEKPQPCNSAAQ